MALNPSHAHPILRRAAYEIVTRDGTSISGDRPFLDGIRFTRKARQL
jgi:hypothetical protein